MALRARHPGKRGLTNGALARPIYIADVKYHQRIPEVKYLDPSKLKRMNAGEVSAVSPEVARMMDFSSPVEVSVFAGGDMRIVDGHHRVAAAKQLGRPRIAVTLQAINAKGETINKLIKESKGLE